MEFFMPFILSLFSSALCFNLDTKHALVYDNPDPYDNQSYFGYSVILYPKDEYSQAWIQIAAPKGMDPHVDNIKSGIIYRCYIGDICYNLQVHNFVNQRTALHEYGWVGNAMDIDYNFKKYVICAYRWLNIANDEYKFHRNRGKCFWRSIFDDRFHALTPLENSNLNYSTLGQAGFSVQMSKNKFESEILLGAPGINNWQGTTIIYRHSTGTITTYPHRRTGISKEFGESNIIPAVNNMFNSFDLLGYSVSSGYFFDSDQLIYVAGAPRANRYMGKILFFKYNRQRSFQALMTLGAEDPKFGEYYGASIAVGDFNNDRFDDIVVGAPFYANNGYNQGRVLLYLGSKEGKFISPIQSSIIGKLSGGQFGLAITVLGDIDLDNFCDIAVAAPFADNGRGIVYIYRGCRSGLNTEPSQIIKAREIDNNLRAFGSSFSKAIDIDENHYDDVAIGAYKSGHAVLLRSKPILVLKQIVTSQTKKVAYGDSNFTIEHCVWYMGSFLPNITHVVRKFTLDPIYQRAFFITDNQKNIELTEETTFCDNITIFLKNTTIFLPIIINTEISLVEPTVDMNIVHVHRNHSYVDTFCSKCPIFNKHASDMFNRLEIPFSIGCGDENICRAMLKINYTFEDVVNNTFVVGANSNLLNLIVKIKNVGQKAFKTELNLELPNLVYFANGSHNEPFDIANPLNENEERKLVISLDMSRINSESQQIESLRFFMNVTSSSVIVDVKDTKKVATLFIKRVADIYLTGISEEQTYSFGNFTVGSVNLTQIYTVQKYGPSPIDASRLFIEVPTKLLLTTNETVDILNLLTSEESLSRDEIGLHCETNITKVAESLQSHPLNNEYYDRWRETDDTAEATQSPRQLLKRQTRNVEIAVKGYEKNEAVLVVNLEDDDMNMEDINKKSNEKISNDRVLFLNCNSTNVICEEIICHVGKLVDQQNTAVYRLKMMLNIGVLKELALKEHKDVIVFTTKGDVYIDDPFNFVQTGNRSDEAVVSTVILGPQPKYSVPLWIIIISVIGSLLLLMFLILFLVKVGFFRRKKREELAKLKKDVQARVCNVLSSISIPQ